tara:strand:- start:3639 stop:4025 length:387 start_codon:yes stop_codon:yes gene_type:complete
MKWIIFRDVKIDEDTLDVVWDIQELCKYLLSFKVPYSSEKIDGMNEILQDCKKTLDMGYDLWGADIEGKLYRIKFSEIESQLEPRCAKWYKYLVSTTNRKTQHEFWQWVEKEQPETYDRVNNSSGKLN